MREWVEAAADADQLWSNAQRLLAQPVEIDRVVRGIDGSGMSDDAEHPGRPGGVVRHVAADLRRRCDDGVARRADRQEHVEVGERAGPHAQLDEAGAEHFGGEFGGDDFDPLDRLQPHLDLVARIAERGARPEPGSEQRLGARVHGVAGGVEVDAVALVDRTVAIDEAMQLGVERVGVAGGSVRQRWTRSGRARGGTQVRCARALTPAGPQQAACARRFGQSEWQSRCSPVSPLLPARSPPPARARSRRHAGAAARLSPARYARSGFRERSGWWCRSRHSRACRPRCPAKNLDQQYRFGHDALIVIRRAGHAEIGDAEIGPGTNARDDARLEHGLGTRCLRRRDGGSAESRALSE